MIFKIIYISTYIYLNVMWKYKYHDLKPSQTVHSLNILHKTKYITELTMLLWGIK